MTALPQSNDSTACPRCGVIDQPLLSVGTGPHRCKASCAHCGRFLRWISTLAPSERIEALRPKGGRS
jgi:hypothetical protein